MRQFWVLLAGLLAAVGVVVGVSGAAAPADPGCAPEWWPQPRQSSCASSSATDPQAPSAEAVRRLRLAWAYGARAPVGNPIVDDGVVYFVSVGRRSTSRMHAVDLASGRKIWKGKAYRDLSAAPIADNGALIGFFSGALLRYELRTGHVISGGQYAGGMSGGVTPDPVVADGNLYWSGADVLWALDPVSGKQRWVRYLECFVCGVAASGGRVYAAGTLAENADIEVPPAVYALDARSGATIWSTPAPTDTVILADGRVIAVTKSVQGDVWAFFIEAFRATDGERLWRTPVGSIDALDFTQPAADGTLVIYPSPDGNLYALNAANGSLRWKVRIGRDLAVARKHSTAAIANGVVWIVRTEGGKDRLRAFDARNGRQLWHSAPFNHVDDLRYVPSPVVAGGYVLVGTNGGRILAYRAPSR